MSEPKYPQITESIIYALGNETTKKLNERQEELERIVWKDGEANLDTEYSKLACECCKIVWYEMKRKYPEYSEIEIICEIPDINITFIYPSGKKKQKIELKSSKSKLIKLANRLLEKEVIFKDDLENILGKRLFKTNQEKIFWVWVDWLLESES
jgi:hypothetical protein